jgi:CRISPR-associated protein Csh1
MIIELINFTDSLHQDVFTWNKKPSDGLHIFLNMETDKRFQALSFSYYSAKKERDDQFPQHQKDKITGYESFGRRIGTTMNKTFHKKLFACNPFIISFKKKNLNELGIDDFGDFLNTAEDVAKLSIHEREIGKLFILEVNRLKSNVLKSLTQTTTVIDKKKGNHEKDEAILSLLGQDDYINFYLESFPNDAGEVCPTQFKKYHDSYLNQKGFNKDDAEYKIGLIKDEEKVKYVFNNKLLKKEKDGKGKDTKHYSNEFVEDYKNYSLEKNFGISDYLNGLNSKKPYLEHKTAMFHKGISEYIDGEMAQALYKFEQLVSVNRVLPNPLPIIIWKENSLLLKKEELALEENIFLKEFKETIAIFKDKEIRLGFTEILKNLFERNPSFKLRNFYLLNFSGGKLRDFDFVEEFQYRIEGLAIKEIFKRGEEKVNKEPINNIFDFEWQIVQKLFDNGLVTEKEIEVDKRKYTNKTFKYFENLKDTLFRGNMFLLVTKYRKAFYDYIYKSKRDALNANIIEEILTIGLLDDIRHDEYRNNKHTNKIKIYNKLNIWFSLYDYFLKTVNKNKTMASKIDQFKNDLIKIIKGQRSLEDNEVELFAYVAGQVVYYIQSKSRSADKSYARLEPFLNKTGSKEFKLVLKEEFAKYKHERYSSEFNRPFAQVNVYPLSQNMKDMLPFFLGGYFSKNLLFPGATNE